MTFSELIKALRETATRGCVRVPDEERLREGEWCQKLREWSEKERENGLIDVKFMPVHPVLPGEKEPTLEELARGYYLMLTSTDVVDVTHENL